MSWNNLIRSNAGYIRPVKALFWCIFNLALMPLILFVYVCDPLLKIRFVKIRDDRIGHLAANTEIFLRRLELGIISKKKSLYIGISSTNPVNKQLLNMFKRKMVIIHVPKLLCELAFAEKSVLAKTGFGMHLLQTSYEFREFTYGKPSLYFTESEEKKGKKLLKAMNISAEDWFICFHARSSKYLAEHLMSIDGNYFNFRNWDINNALKAAKYIASKGGFALRMGAIVEKKLPDLKNKRVIDYASGHRTEFGDIYLPSKCKFFLGCSCGISNIAQIFNVPVVWCNLIPITLPPYSKRDLFIPKKLWSAEKKRFLTFREILESGVGDFGRQEQYERMGLKPIENTPEEILDLAIEMNERLDGTWKPGKEDEKLQKKFRSLFKKDSRCYGFPSRIGAMFLRENKFLLK